MEIELPARILTLGRLMSSINIDEPEIEGRMADRIAKVDVLAREILVELQTSQTSRTRDLFGVLREGRETDGLMRVKLVGFVGYRELVAGYARQPIEDVAEGVACCGERDDLGRMRMHLDVRHLVGKMLCQQKFSHYAGDNEESCLVGLSRGLRALLVGGSGSLGGVSAKQIDEMQMERMLQGVSVRENPIRQGWLGSGDRRRFRKWPF